MPRPPPPLSPHLPSHRVPTLPVLTGRNRKAHARWHAYYERVYGVPVRGRVDLNAFTWFYWSAPFDPPLTPRTQLRIEDARRPRLHTPVVQTLVDAGRVWLGDVALKYEAHLPTATADRLRLRDGDAFRGRMPTVCRTRAGLMSALSFYGFFVCRPTMLPDPFDPHRIEVLRVRDTWAARGVWYWCVRGSGVYLDVAAYGGGADTVHVTPRRASLSLFQRPIPNKSVLDALDDDLPAFVRSRGWSAVVFREAHGVPELLVVDAPASNPDARVRIGTVAGLDPGYVVSNPASNVDERCRVLRRLDGDASTRVPLWHTPLQAAVHDWLCRPGTTTRAQAVRLLKATPTAARMRELNAWVPVHARRDTRAGRLHDLDALCPLLVLATLLGRASACRTLKAAGATLTSTPPAHLLGHDDLADAPPTGASFLETVATGGPARGSRRRARADLTRPRQRTRRRVNA